MEESGRRLIGWILAVSWVKKNLLQLGTEVMRVKTMTKFH